MSLGKRERRALIALAVCAVLAVALALFWSPSSGPQVVGASESIPAAEKRLKKVRQIASGAAGREALLKQVSAELAERDKGVIRADTAAQAQAQLLDVARRVAKSEKPPLRFGAVEMGQKIEPFGDDYGEVQVSVPFTCQIEDLVNFLTDLTKQPEAIATKELRVSAGDAKEKTVSVRLTIAGLAPRRLAPEKKGPVF